MTFNNNNNCYAAPTTSYAQLLQQAAFLNSAGATGLMTGESSDACLHVFNEALALMEQVSMCPDLQKVGSEPPRVSNTIECPSSFCSGSNDGSDDRFFVCRQALTFAPDYGTTPGVCNISEVDLSFYSAVIIFNMALTYHQTGLQQGDSPLLLQNALQLYDHCRQILNTILSPPGDDTDMLKLVTLNNQAQIHYVCMQSFSTVAPLLEEIRKLCPVLLLNNSGCTAQSQSPQCNKFYSVKTMKEISMNALLVTGPPTAAPVA